MSELLAAPQVDINDALTDMWRAVLLVVPKLVAFLAILLIGWLVATALRNVVDKLLERVGFDRAVERGGIGRALERTRFDASDILAKLVYYGLLLFTLQLAFGVWGPNPISDLLSGVVAWLPKAAVGIIIVVVAAAIASAVRELVSGALGGLSYGRLLANLAAWFIIGIGAVAALNQVGIATTVTTPVLIAILATVAGVLIVGVGGGMVRPMQQRWERWLGRIEEESSAIREQAQAYAAGRRDAARAGAPTEALSRGYLTPDSGTYVSQTAAGAPTPGVQTAGAAAPGGGYAEPPTTELPAQDLPPGPRPDDRR
jgi:hypothetical protein